MGNREWKSRNDENPAYVIGVNEQTSLRRDVGP